MAQRVFEARGLPDDPLDAAAAFHASFGAPVRAALGAGDDLVLVFDPADHAHAGWRLALVQDLARSAAPLRVNAVVGGEGAALDETVAYLASAPGVTGQVLMVDAIRATSA
ncbi:hypothetical protein M3P36_06300 [Altererythrobacter sp. KTW20L]|uniref:Rossmann fold domain-containing protein n=1 Tax=Altererythrobacter sp. KTW20L TaxID=2942210 RepID=UPI0020C05B45|nr:hypothetical protein [Altererythrobacter sp. KTW20L]MCL6250655.1 hypothetical protein [Altererythrobacter sp. KTW20L]